LTGETLPVSKHGEADPMDTELADRRSMAYSGTLVVGGQATGLAVATGRSTELGRIGHLLGEVQSTKTPLVRQLGRFALQLSLVLGALTLALIVLGIGLHDMPLAEAMLAGVALMVAAVPEGLPPVITITLAIGVTRMAAKRAVVRRLPMVETLGSVTAICSDKTGTLTANRLSAERALLGGRPILKNIGDLDGPRAARLSQAAVLCNHADPGTEQGDPIEIALVEMAGALGHDALSIRRQQPRQDLQPFDSEARYMATRHDDRTCFKGAPEVVLDRCRDTLDEQGQRVAVDREAWNSALHDQADTGARLLAIAEGPCDAPLDLDRACELTLLGVIAFDDPLRPGVREAIAACRSAGMTVRMITGDHPATARSIAQQLGMDRAERPLTGHEIQQLDDQALREKLRHTHVLARTTSADKLRIVQALQADGEVVAMTGDGANDAPALKRAEVGIAMGVKGTEAAREASGIVLADDNFATLVAGIEEGRGAYDNIRKALAFLLPTSAAEALVILLAVISGITLPLTPIQVLWVNMVTAVTLALALAFEPLEHDVMHRPPRPPGGGLLDRMMLVRIVAVALFLTAAVFGLFELTLALGHDEALARTVALNVLVAGEAFYLFNCRRAASASWTPAALVANPIAGYCLAALALLQLALMYAPPLQTLFGLAPLDGRLWILSLAPGLVLFVLVEIGKAIGRKTLGRKTMGRSRQRSRSDSPRSSSSSR
jgi:calcium-translocating P-type ATPase